MFERFIESFGTASTPARHDAQPGSSVPVPDLNVFMDRVGRGVFKSGLLSVGAVREDVPSLGGWETLLPAGSYLFGTSAFGHLLTTSGEDAWMTDTQYGETMQLSARLIDAFDMLASHESLDEIFMEPLFTAWSEIFGPLPATSVLCPVPAIPLGGTWSVEALAPMPLHTYLRFTFELHNEESL